jgi:hypothetical protein
MEMQRERHGISLNEIDWPAVAGDLANRPRNITDAILRRRATFAADVPIQRQIVRQGEGDSPLPLAFSDAAFAASFYMSIDCAPPVFLLLLNLDLQPSR